MKDEDWILRLEDLFTSMVSQALEAEGKLRIPVRGIVNAAPFARQDPDHTSARSVAVLMAWTGATEVIL